MDRRKENSVKKFCAKKNRFSRMELLGEALKL
jgi:hypothetical protein